MSDSTLSKDAIVIERVFDAPVDLVWQMWTHPEHFKKWYGPQGFNVPVAEMDVRVGGKHRFCMQTGTPPGSMTVWSTGEYTEVVPNQRLVYTESITDETGNRVASSAMTEITVRLEDLNGRTRMVMTHAGIPADAEGANAGWTQAFEKLAAYLETVSRSQ